jgi:hypothetical protein
MLVPGIYSVEYSTNQKVALENFLVELPDNLISLCHLECICVSSLRDFFHYLTLFATQFKVFQTAYIIQGLCVKLPMSLDIEQV